MTVEAGRPFPWWRKAGRERETQAVETTGGGYWGAGLRRPPSHVSGRVHLDNCHEAVFAGSTRQAVSLPGQAAPRSRLCSLSFGAGPMRQAGGSLLPTLPEWSLWLSLGHLLPDLSGQL